MSDEAVSTDRGGGVEEAPDELATIGGEVAIDLAAEHATERATEDPRLEPWERSGPPSPPASPSSSSGSPAESERASTSDAARLLQVRAERDRWRERAVLWHERALAAEKLVELLQDHVGDLQAISRDLRQLANASSRGGSGAGRDLALPPSSPRGARVSVWHRARDRWDRWLWWPNPPTPPTGSDRA